MGMPPAQGLAVWQEWPRSLQKGPGGSKDALRRSRNLPGRGPSGWLQGSAKTSALSIYHLRQDRIHAISNDTIPRIVGMHLVGHVACNAQRFIQHIVQV